MYRKDHNKTSEIIGRLTMGDTNNSDPVGCFLGEILGETSLDFLPQTLLWDMFRQWVARNDLRITSLKRPEFIKEIKQIMKDRWSLEWEYKEDPVYANRLMNICEPLFEKYNLSDWHQGSQMKCEKLNMRHRGYKRIKPRLDASSYRPEGTVF